MPRSPSLPSSGNTSLGNSARSNHPSISGSTLSRTQSRTVSRIIRSSSEKSASRSRKSTGSSSPAGIRQSLYTRCRTAGKLPAASAERSPTARILWGVASMAGEKTRGPRFGQEDAELSYGSYLRIPELLRLQSGLSSPPAHDELLFIVVHQAYELWFKEILFELEAVRSLLFAADTHRARHLMGRVHSIERVLVEHIGVIETMTPQDFLEFRSNLAPASGFQS